MFEHEPYKQLPPDENVTYVTYNNPCDDRIDVSTFAEFAIRHPTFLRNFDEEITSLEEYFLQFYPKFPVESPRVSKWHEDTTHWIPEPVKEWWLDQFTHNDSLSAMRSTWWQCRARTLTAALESGDETRPIGAVALTIIRTDERLGPGQKTWTPMNWGRSLSLFYEMRGLVTTKRERGLLVRHALRVASELSPQLPVVAVTTSPRAASLFAKAGATNQPNPPSFEYLSGIYKQLCCWCSPKSHNLCPECPQRPNQSWWWPPGFNPLSETHTTAETT
jgi:hypothetical protein